MILTYRDYVDFAERSLSQACNEIQPLEWALIPATILSWSAIESFVNNVIDDFASLPKDMFELHKGLSFSNKDFSLLIMVIVLENFPLRVKNIED